MNPGRKIPFSVERLNGITTNMVALAAPFNEIAPKILEFIHEENNQVFSHWS